MSDALPPRGAGPDEAGAEVVGVAELVRRLGRAVQSVSGREWVEGEVTQLRVAESGHAYFTLKDDREEARLDCVAYRQAAARARSLLQPGARVQVFGGAAVYAARGRLQLVADRIRAAGRGALLEALERLKQRLAAEGLFAAERKRPLPPEPRVVGVVTSRHGAAVHDIIAVARQRGRVRIVLSPALVQGEGAPASLVRALDRIEALPGLDVVIVGRGGGASEDLMAFNDEAVVRRIAGLRVPVVSAVGHEIDVTLSDLAADLRAATPSHAAELVVPDERAARARLSAYLGQLARAMRGRILEDRDSLGRLRARLGDPRVRCFDAQQALDELRARLGEDTRRRLARARTTLADRRQALAARHPRAVLAGARGQLGQSLVRLDALEQRRLTAERTRLGALEVRLGIALRDVLRARGARLEREAARLGTLSPLAVLERGYAIVTCDDGRALVRSRDTATGARVRVRLHEGRVEATVDRVEEGE
ncbi:MAG: exodeoxyribonuclease VII large subunit [Polyangiaceae bacterium]|nr:exodeoxyribonuclease VII large subunit [Polyangiaceae bacterium]